MKLTNFFNEKLKLMSNFKTWVIPMGLFWVALAVRIPWLWEVPRYIDELREVNLGYQIYLGQIFPLHNAPKDIGALHNYLLAGIFSLFGPNPYWPRLYVAITSALTVVLVYYLGKKLFNQIVGSIAAGLLLTNGMNILVTHMAWSNCTTPFFFILAILATILAEEKKSGKWLITAGFLWALTLQTHSSVIIYLLVALIYVLSPGFRKNTGFRATDYLKASVAFTLGYANMIVFNLTSGFESIRWLSAKQYTLEADPGIVSYANNAFQMLIELIRSLSSTYPSYESPWGYLKHPAFILALFLLGGGILRALKNKGPIQGPKLLVGIIAGGFLVIPWINHRYGFFIVTRYIMPVIICAIILVGSALTKLYEIFYMKVGAFRKSRVLARAPLAAGMILVLVLVVQLVPFYQYCQKVDQSDLSNHISLEVLHRVREISGGRKAVVLIDRNLTEQNPLSILFKINNIKYISLPKDILSRSSFDFQIIFKKNHLPPDAQIVAILSTPVYNQLKAEIPVVKEEHFSKQLLLNVDPGVIKEEVIHFTEIGSPQNLYAVNMKPQKS